MKRRHAAILVALAVVLVVWRAAARPASRAERATATDPTSTRQARAIDPRKSPRGEIRGTVHAAGRPLAGARVCADPAATPSLPTDAVRDAHCTDSDAAGGYAIADLFADDYTITASAHGKRPAVRAGHVRVRAGAVVDAIDLVLGDGGSEVTGTVVDIAGGPIAHAQVRVGAGSADLIAETDDRGAFSITVAAGDTQITADADGYASASAPATAPGRVELRLVPESSVSGTVVGAADGVPLAGAHVSVSGVDWALPYVEAITDEQGRFEAARLKPGRYAISAVGPGATGGVPGSLAVGLGEHTTGLVIEVYPAFAVEGRIVAGAAPCADGAVVLDDREHARRLDGRTDLEGTLRVDGVLPGTYRVAVSCTDHAAREHYPPIVVADRDVRGVTWEVDAGAAVHGRITVGGAPLEGATVQLAGATTVEATSGADGTYAVRGATAGSYRIQVTTRDGVATSLEEAVELTATGDVERDVDLDPVATVRGVVVDHDGTPLDGVAVRTDGGRSTRSSPDGSFVITGLAAGEIRLYAMTGAVSRVRDTDDDEHVPENVARVTIGAGETATVRLVVDAPPAQPIRGVVVDTAGHPVADAIVELRGYDALPVPPALTGEDGTFRTEPVRAVRYEVHASAPGRGEATASAVAPGGTVRLELAAFGTIAGHVTGAADELSITVHGNTNEVWRTETFFHAGGEFALRELPPGHYTVSFDSESGYAMREVDVAAGDTALDITLTPLVTITGRVVSSDTHEPVAGISVGVRYDDGYDRSEIGEIGENITDDRGRFVLHRVRAGHARLRCASTDSYEGSYADRELAAGDVGDLEVTRVPPPPVYEDDSGGDTYVEVSE